MLPLRNVDNVSHHSLFVVMFHRLFYRWTTGEDRPASGSLVQLITEAGKTEATPV